MSPALLSPQDAAALLGTKIERAWAEHVSAELTGKSVGPLEVHVRRGVNTSADVGRLGFEAWTQWRMAWRDFTLHDLSGIEVDYRDIGVQGVKSRVLHSIRVSELDAGQLLLMRLGGHAARVEFERARRLGAQLYSLGIDMEAGRLRQVYQLSDTDAGVLMALLGWLGSHEDLSTWTARELPVPGMDTKWLQRQGALVHALTGRDVLAETQPRSRVVNMTYVDPDYLAAGGPAHASWTSGDSHELPYRPEVILIVENEDSRIRFLPTPRTLVLQGGGMAASSLLRDIPWLDDADHVVYWGDIDCDGFLILDGLRRVLRGRGISLRSILMDSAAAEAWAHLGVIHDKNGKPLGPRSNVLAHLTADEAACHARVATAGAVPFRRIEQERIPRQATREALLDLVRPLGLLAETC